MADEKETTTIEWDTVRALVSRHVPLRRKIEPLDIVPYCCGRAMDRAVTARMYECACGRSVTDDVAIATIPDDGSRGSWRGSWTNSGPMRALSAPIVAAPVQACACGTARCAGVDCSPVDRVRPVRVDDFAVWRSMRDRDRALADMPPERHAELCDGLMFGTSPDAPDAVSLSEDYCINARRSVDEWLVSSMDDLMRKCEAAGSPFEKRWPVMFSGRPECWWQEDYSAARSRLLAAKVAASDAARVEADRRIVLGPIDDPDEA